MSARLLSTIGVLLLAVAPALARAASFAHAITPTNVSVAGNESATFSVQFLDAQGHPAVGETASFSNDACGTFPNGRISYSTTTDANGIASARFTALAQGITCTLVASDGASVEFAVLTYLPQYADLVAEIPPRILPGESFTVTAAVAYGAYDLANVDITARIVPGTASANIAPTPANTGDDGKVRLTVTPDGRIGDFQVELQFRDRVRDFPVAALATPWQDMWWAGTGENGWGMSVVQHQGKLFSVIYAYDAARQPTWCVMSAGTWNTAHTVFTGPLFRPHGTPFSTYDAAAFAVGAPVGQASIDFGNPSNVQLSYTIDGVSGRKSITRQPFGPLDLSGGITVGDMWWGGLAQNGWGLAVLQQYNTLFVVWFTYDAGGNPTWYVMPSGHWTDAQTWQGRIDRATGSPWLGQPYDASQFHIVDAGSFRLHFDGDTGTFDYTIGTQSGSIAIARQPF